MREIIFILASLGLLICFFRIEIYFIHKSREKFLEAGRAYKKLKEAEQNLHNLLQDKDL
jgi:hypothetical protein